jgi:uncharacterized membrane protein YfcA
VPVQILLNGRMKHSNIYLVFGSGAAVGTLGGLIGLGGAEFRLPLLIGLFGFSALPAVMLNKAMSLAVVASALLFRASTVPWVDVFDHWSVIVTLLAGSLLGAWFGAGWVIALKAKTLHRMLAGMLLTIACVLLVGHDAHATATPMLSGAFLALVGAVAGFGIGVIASLLGVAGGELLIPTIVLLFGADIKLAGSLSLVVSLPTMIVGFSRYSKDQSFSVIREQWPFVITMVAGSLVGSFMGSRLLGVFPSNVLLPVLSLILGISAIKVWR